MKYYRYSFLFWIVLVAYQYGHSQDSIQSVVLNEIKIYGLVSQRYITGSQQVDYSKFLLNTSSSVAEILQQQSTIYMKSYGNNMLSTISLRGTGAGHTSLIWNGLNINSPTLGQTDFSQIPSIAGNEMAIQYGGASALYGNESIGGSILLNSGAVWLSKPELNIYQDIGSFGTTHSQVEFRVGKNKIESVTRAYHTYSKNDFLYSNILKPNQPDERQKNAGVRMLGLLQDLYFKAGTNGQLDMHFWVHSSNREIQPTIANPDNTDFQEDQNLRTTISYQTIGDWGRLNVRSGYVIDDMIFNNSFQTLSKTGTVRVSLGKQISYNLEVDGGVGFKNIAVNTNNYSEPVVEKRWKGFLWAKFTPFPIWQLVLNVRKENVESYDIPLAPSIGSDLYILQNLNSKIVWKLTASDNYRIPTLNDRFWNPGGNKDLLPETSSTIDTSIDWDHKSENGSFSTQISVYKMWVENWILWIPNGNIWTPENIRNVDARGLELSFSGETLMKMIKVYWKLGYSYTESTNKSVLDTLDRSFNKQLPFVPFHNAMSQVGVVFKTFDINIKGNYTGERFITTDNESSLDDYFLVDLDVYKNSSVYGVMIKTGVGVYNLFNATYFNLPFRAMPGINFRLYINFNF